MRLYHDRQSERTGAIDARDEEECFTAAGRRVGVWLSTEIVAGSTAYAADVDVAAVETYEVTVDGSSDRTFVVPGSVVERLGFSLT